MRVIYNRLNVLTHVSRVRIPPAPSRMLSLENMKVEKEKFDALLSSVLKTKPVPREKIKARKKHAPKTPILQKP